MGPQRRRLLNRWGELLLTSSLAAVIAAVGSFITDGSKSVRDVQVKRCEIAQAFLSDETPTPYMDERTRRRITLSAAASFERCMRER